MKTMRISLIAASVIAATGVIWWSLTRGQPNSLQTAGGGISQMKVTPGDSPRVDRLFKAIASSEVGNDTFQAQDAALDLQVDDLPPAITRLSMGPNDMQNEQVLAACLAVSPLTTASLVNGLDQTTAALGLKKMMMEKMRAFGSATMSDMRNPERVHNAHPSAIFEIMRVHRDILAKDFLSVANAFSALLAEGGTFDDNALVLLKDRQDTVKEIADLSKILDYAHSSVGGVGEEGMKRFTEHYRNIPASTRTPLINQIIQYSDDR